MQEMWPSLDSYCSELGMFSLGRMGVAADQSEAESSSSSTAGDGSSRGTDPRKYLDILFGGVNQISCGGVVFVCVFFNLCVTACLTRHVHTFKVASLLDMWWGPKGASINEL